MKKIVLVILLICALIHISYTQVISKTETITPTIKGITHTYDWSSSYLCTENSYTLQSGSNGVYFVGFESVTGSTCSTQKTYNICASFSHPNFINSAMTSVTFKFDMKYSGTFTPYPDLKVIIASSSCATDQNLENLFECIDIGDGELINPLTEGEIPATDSWVTQSLTINSTSFQKLAVFDQNSTNFYLGFYNDSKIIDIKNIKCDVTYNCTLPSTPTGFDATSVSTSRIDLSWNNVSGAEQYEIYSCTGSSPLYTVTSSSYSITTGLLSGTTYSYRIKAKNGCGKSNYSSCVSATTPLATPTNLRTSSQTGSTINLEWNTVTRATYYDIYTCNDIYVGTTDKNYFCVTGLSQLTNYSYKVNAKNSSSSSPFTTCVNCKTKLSEPSNLSISDISSSSLKLSWSGISGATNYKIYSCSGSLIATTTSTSYIFTSLQGGTNYSYKVCASDGVNVSDYSTCISTYTLPNTPQITSVTPLSGSSIRINWGAVFGADLYEIYSCTGTLIGNTANNSFTVTGLAQLTNYSYKVLAKNVTGISMFSICENTTTLLSEPTNFKATAISSTAINLTWNSVVSAIQYKIYSCSGTLIGTTSSTSFSITGLNEGTNYSFKINATDNVNTSNFTSCNAVYTFPGIPEQFTVTPLSGSSLRLDWGSVTGATGYNIYSCTGSLIGTTMTNSYIISGLSQLTNYSYKVLAKNDSGNSLFSECKNATTKLSEPTNLTVSEITTTSVKLSWNSVVSATAYNIYSCSGALIATISSTNYTINNLSSGTNYSYKINAVSGGNVSNYTSCKSFFTLPEVPNPNATPTSISSIALTWNSIVGATNYNVYTCSGTLIGSSTTTSYTVSGLSQATLYGYKIEAVNSSGSSGYSVCVSATTFIVVPSNFKVRTISNSELQLLWDDVSGASYYEIYSCSGDFIANTNENNFILNNLISNTTYSYKIRAVNVSSVSPYSLCKSSTTLLSTPVISIQKKDQLSLRVSWSSVDGACDYDIYSANNEYITTTGNLYYDFNSLSAGNGVFVKVRANHCSDNSLNSFFSNTEPGFISPSCVPWLTIFAQNYNYDVMKKSADYIIISNSSVLYNSAVVLEAKNLITIQKDFSVSYGSYFHASIADCNSSNLKSSNELNSETSITEDKNEVTIFPNPTSGYTKISGIVVGSKIEIFNNVGAIIFSDIASESEYELSLDNCTEGVYLVKLTDREDAIIRKLIIK